MHAFGQTVRQKIGHLLLFKLFHEHFPALCTAHFPFGFGGLLLLRRHAGHVRLLFRCTENLFPHPPGHLYDICIALFVHFQLHALLPIQAGNNFPVFVGSVHAGNVPQADFFTPLKANGNIADFIHRTEFVEGPHNVGGLAFLQFSAGQIHIFLR